MAIGKIYRWVSGVQKNLIRTSYGGGIAFTASCCCGTCCGRNMPGTSAPMYPVNLSYTIHGIVVNNDPMSMCTDCTWVDVTGVAEWGGPIEGGWIDTTTACAGTLPIAVKIICQNRIKNTGSCGVKLWGSHWAGSLTFGGTCVDPISGSPNVVTQLEATLNAACFCDPLVLESPNFNLTGICCLGCFPGNATLQFSVWE